LQIDVEAVNDLHPRSSYPVSTTSAKESTTKSGASHATPSAAEEQEKRHFTVGYEKPGDSANFSWEEGNVTTTVYYNNHCCIR
jgi:hypothetical protein